MADPLTRSLEELRRADEPRFGGKSASLGELLCAGIPVPPGFALSAAADELTDALREEIAHRYAALGTDEPPVAVRSSAIGEDSAEATYAGQQETVLWVRGVEAVCGAVRTCWASLHSPTAVAYRERLGTTVEPAMGVAIQLMVDAEVSGVMFTCSPVSGDPSMVAINASWGLGLAVVGGEVTPDEYLVSKITREVVRERVNHKHVEYRPAADGHGAVARSVPDARADARCLDAGLITTLVDVARRIERHFGGHQDIEWAMADGEVFILQSRPVTARAQPRAAPAADAMSLVMRTFGAS